MRYHCPIPGPVFPLPLNYGNAGMRSGRRCIVLTSPFGASTSLGYIEANAGMISDGGTIPQIAFSIIGDPFGEYLEPCVIHDYLYSPANVRFNRKESDMILKELMWNCGIDRWKTEAFWLAVRCGGKAHFKGTKK